MAIMGFIRELRRRRVFRLAGIYLIAAWLLLQVADVTFEPLGLPGWSMTALVWVVAVGFPVALALSWRYDITDDGLVRITPAHDDGSVDLSLTRFDYGLLVSVLVVAALVAYTLVDRVRVQRADVRELPELAIRDDTVAVLPFENLSTTPDDEYFSDGVAQEILNTLAQVSQLRVIARTSSFSFKNKAVDIRDIAEQLGARNIVEGSVRRSGDRLRITAQLIDAVSGTHLWSATYEREAGDIFEVQENIAQQIVVAMRTALRIAIDEPMGAHSTTDNVEAYDRYLLGNYYYWQRGRQQLEMAIELFREALELDPDYAHAWAALSAAYNSAGSHGADVGDRHPQELAAEAAERAVELDETLGLAWAVLGNTKSGQHRSLGAGVPYFMRAIDVSPNEPTVLHWRAEGNMMVGRVSEALASARKVYEMDPTTPTRSIMVGCANALAGNYDRGLQYINTVLESGINHFYPWECGLWAVLGKHDIDLIEAWLAKSPSGRRAEAVAAEQAFLAALREPDSISRREQAVARIMSAYQDHEDGPRIPGPVARLLLVFLGANDAAYVLVNERFDHGLWSPQAMWFLPYFSEFRRDPRFASIVERSTAIEFWRSYGWADACRPAGESFTCD